MTSDSPLSDPKIQYRQMFELLFEQHSVADVDMEMSVKEVYAHFGLAYYESEVLHRGLCHLYVFSRFSSRNDVTGPRLDELFAHAYSSTLGEIFSKVADCLPIPLRDRIEDAVKKRNFLAHHFWFERASQFLNSTGRQEMIKELASCRDLFSELDKAVSSVFDEKLGEFGLTEEELQKAASEEIADGRPLELLGGVRKLKREEILSHVWLVPLKTGGRTLAFELSDGTLWQLCDIGLGWTYLSKNQDWVEYLDFSKYLPAKINPRPKITKAWEYEFKLSNSAVFWVKSGVKPRTVKWGFKSR